MALALTVRIFESLGASPEQIEKLRQLYMDVEDKIEGVE